MSHLQPYLELIKQSRLLAANLKDATLVHFTGNADAGNKIARCAAGGETRRVGEGGGGRWDAAAAGGKALAAARRSSRTRTRRALYPPPPPAP